MSDTKVSARDRMRAYRDRKRGVHQHGTGCLACGTILSRYNPDTWCATCTPKIITHAQYLDEFDPAIEVSPLTGVNTCKRGHDLLEHGRMVHAEKGRMTRRCSICRKERQKLYARERRARLKYHIA